MPLSPSDIKTIVDSLRASNWDEAVVTVGDTRIAVARNGKSLSPLPAEKGNAPEPARTPMPDSSAQEAPASVAATPAAAPVVAAAPPSSGDHVVTSPSVGVFWQAPEPGAEPFVKVGQLIKAGDTLGIVEIMKLMSNISADVSGIVTAIHVENAGAVEFGTPLVSIKPEA